MIRSVKNCLQFVASDQLFGAQKQNSVLALWEFLMGTDIKILSGDDSAWATPVPIPNTEVKPGCADGTALAGE